METFDLGRIIQTSEAIKAMRQQGQEDQLRNQYLGVQMDNAKQAGQFAANEEQRKETQFTQEQQLFNTRMVNVAAKSVLADPSSVGRWLPELKKSGVLAADFDPTTVSPDELKAAAQRVAAQTDTELQAYLSANPQMAELDKRHQLTLAEIAARQEAEAKTLGIQNKYSMEQIQERGKQDRQTTATASPVKNRAEAQKLRKEFEGLQTVQNYRAVEPLLKSAANAPDNGYGDLDIIYAVGKILDPGSVVREGELKLTIDAGSPLQKVLGSTRFNFEQGGRLTPKQRQQVLGMLKGRAGAVKEAYDREKTRFSGYATGAGLEANDVVGADTQESSPSDQVHFIYVPGQGLQQAP